mgnify:CR=1 FL=1
MERAWIFLEDGEFDSVKQYVERVLDREPRNGVAYWLKCLAELRVREEGALSSRMETLSNSGNYQKALRFGDDDLRSRLEKCERDIQKRMEEKRRREAEERETCDLVAEPRVQN